MIEVLHGLGKLLKVLHNYFSAYKMLFSCDSKAFNMPFVGDLERIRLSFVFIWVLFEVLGGFFVFFLFKWYVEMSR